MEFIKLRKRYCVAAIIIAIFLFGSAIIVVSLRNPLADQINPAWRVVLMRQPFVLHLLHTYHSLRKLPDILFLPYIFKSSQIPAYTLNIRTDKIATLNSKLSSDPFSGQLRNDDRLWVKAVFSAGDYKDEVKVRYRGTNANHWNSFQKSWRVNFPEEHLFNGMKALNLIIPYDRKYAIEVLNNYRAKKLGLETVDMYFARLKLNGEDMGVYIVYEQWSDEWLKKRILPEDSLVLGGDDARTPGDTTVATDTIMVPTVNGPAYKKNYSSGAHPNSLETLINLVERADDETFRRSIGQIFDLQKLYAYNVVQILANSQHAGANFDLGNMIMIFNPATGKFEFSPWDVGIGQPDNDQDVYQDNVFNLMRRLFRWPEFREARNKLLASYLTDEKNLQDDLDFYNKLWQETKTDFYQDNAKLYNNFQLRQQVKFYREQIIKNFSLARAVLSYDVDYYQANESDRAVQIETRNSMKLAGSYSRFFETTYTRDEFIANNPQFVKRGQNNVVLPRGTHVFSRDVIIPLGLRFIIEPGTIVYLDNNVSIISYSPLEALGTKDQPIRFLGKTAATTWGTIAVVNTGRDVSRLKFAEFNGGSGAVINGITFTGQAAFHNADNNIANSIFKNARDDDGLNVKYSAWSITDSYFSGNFSDAIDSDFSPKGTVIKNNTFENNGYGGGGDGIDLSWSEILVEGNKINGCTDKGISVGESSTPLIKNNAIEKCDIGIAVKDSSRAEIFDTTIKDSRVGVATYQKKAALKGGVANLHNVVLSGVAVDYETDDLSVINISQ